MQSQWKVKQQRGDVAHFLRKVVCEGAVGKEKIERDYHFIFELGELSIFPC